MKKFIKFIEVWWPLLLLFGGLTWFDVAFIAGTGNPDSVFCLHKIYKQPNGTYEVWWEGRTHRLIKSFPTYEQAKQFQISEVEALNNFGRARPKGERVK